MLSKRVLYYGVDEPLPRQVPLRAGPLSLFYENGDLRYIRLGRREILRRVYVAVRDRNWGTVSPQIHDLSINVDEAAFTIGFEARCQQAEIDFRWFGRITGEVTGAIKFEMKGEARSEFWRNRIGFCVLYPIDECASKPCVVEHSDGQKRRGKFPQLISPHQPFEDISAITHKVSPEVFVEVRFEGDVFEMEDQRNWTDASYKTYCTPLALPFPVLIKRGEKVQQRIKLTLKGDVANPVPTRAPNTVRLGTSSLGHLPPIGLGTAYHHKPLTSQEIERLRTLNLAHLRIDLSLQDESYPDVLRRGWDEARTLDVELEVALHLSIDAENELQGLLETLFSIQPKVARWIIFHKDEASTDAGWVETARRRLAVYGANLLIGAGADSNFTELNRGRPSLEPLDFVVYALNPQVHAFDNLSLVESLVGQAETVTSARQIAGQKPVFVSPVTLRPRFNIFATGPEEEANPNELPSAVDPRQMSLFGAGWTLGSINALAGSGAMGLTYYETTGWRGVMEGEKGSPLPEKFPSLPGAVFPMYHIFADVGEFADGELIPVEISHPLKICALALQKGDCLRVLLANLSATPQQVHLVKMPASVGSRFLDESNAIDAMRKPEEFRSQAGDLLTVDRGQLILEIPPYATIRLDS